MKDWKKDKVEKLKPNDVIRDAGGYGDAFFNAANQLGLKVDGAKVRGSQIQVTFVAAGGNGYSQTAKFPIINGTPVDQRDIFQTMLSMAKVIAQSNPHIRAKLEALSGQSATKREATGSGNTKQQTAPAGQGCSRPADNGEPAQKAIKHHSKT